MLKQSLFALAIAMVSTASNADELLFPNSDFEMGTLEGWTVDGPAFETQPTKGDNTAARNRESSQLQGDWWIGGYERYNGSVGKPGDTAGDGLTGTLTSREFQIKEPYITFRVGGGNLPGELGVNLLCDGQTQTLTSGIDSESMIQQSFDVRQFVGKSARLQIFDQAKAGWGHINVDDFRGTSQATIDRRQEFAFTDGISASGYPEVDYDQPLRPQFHFSSKKNWLNDPNGMVFDGQKYHLFFQHNPKGTAWGNMTWGHATSTDMVRWKQKDHALLPYRIDGQSGTVFSGTAVVDHNNSLGKQVGETKTLVAFYTFATKPDFFQAMAYSTDRGETWTYWNDGRAVVKNQGFDEGERDPKVFWHEASQRWVMALWVQREPGRVRWFTSKNLTDWEVASDLMRDWAYECMDVVFLPVDGDPNQTKCLIYDASFDYEIGTFDGQKFQSETPTLKNVRGNYYAAQSFNQAPDGRVVQIGWMRGGANSAETFGTLHNQQMSFPCEMQLKTTADGVRLFCYPIDEIATLVKETHSWTDVPLPQGVHAHDELKDLDLVDLDITFEPGTAKKIVLNLPRVTLTYDVDKSVLTHTGLSNSGDAEIQTTLDNLKPRDGRVTLRLLIDRLSVEAFAFGGEFFSAHYLHPKSGPEDVSIQAVGGDAMIRSLKVRELKSAW